MSNRREEGLSIVQMRTDTCLHLTLGKTPIYLQSHNPDVALSTSSIVLLLLSDNAEDKGW